MILLRKYIIAVLIFLAMYVYFINAWLSSANTTKLFNPVIETDLGLVKGSVLKTRLGKSFYAFRGIRYGKPPDGELRFQAPEPADMYFGIFDASYDGPVCPQPIKNISVISEDCLRLNVYTKNLTDKKPVLVYIPGGGLYRGSGASTQYGGPQYLMDRDIVLVTMNYRLGIFGFLSLNISEAPGNAGFKDQVLALHWIRDNIEYFGGNSSSVTLVGNSAGGLSVALHLVSPMSQGLFHKGILMSSALRNLEPLKDNDINMARRHSSILNCTNIEKPQDIYACLRNCPTQDLTLSASALFEFAGKHPRLLWGPVIESNFGQPRFLIEQPDVSFEMGRFQKVPIILGQTRNELAPLAEMILKSPQYSMAMDENFEYFAPICFAFARNTNRSKIISSELWNFYNLTHPLALHHLTNLGDLFSDAIINFHIDRLIRMVHKKIDVFYYEFSYQGRHSKPPFGAVHTDDLLYLFVTHFAPAYTVDDPESWMIDKMTRMWAQFATTGNPNNMNENDLKNISWQPYIPNEHYYLSIGNEIQLKKNLNEDRYKIWYKLFFRHLM